jgi:hypothetical protein
MGFEPSIMRRDAQANQISLGTASHHILHDAATAMFGSDDFSPLQKGISSDIIDDLLT